MQWFPCLCPEILETWHSANAVCFDVDSTVCLYEGSDELADLCGAGRRLPSGRQSNCHSFWTMLVV